MNSQKSAKTLLSLILVALTLVACGAAQPASMATLTPVHATPSPSQQAARPTPIPVAPTPTTLLTPTPVAPTRAILPKTATPDGPVPHPSISIVLDDFRPQPYRGEPVYFFNRLEGDRGGINDSILDWGDGFVTTTIRKGKNWGGVWMSLNHPIREGLSVNFSAVSPAQIAPAYQSQITEMSVHIAGGTPNRVFKLELKDRSSLRWKEEVVLKGGEQVLVFDLPALGRISEFVWVLDHANPGDSVIVDHVSFAATTQVTDTATAAFVWSYGMLLDNWNPATGMVRDKARDASGEFDAVQATGSLAAATAIAEQMGVVERTDAVKIVDKISEALLDLPRFHGLWPHWVRVSPAGEFVIVEGTEWSSVDTVIAAIGLLEAQSGLGMDTSATEQMLQEIEWSNLVTPYGISHGYTHAGDPIPHAWDTFGGESWLVELVCAGVTGQVIPLSYPLPPTANGAGFIDELAWLFAPPPSELDYWGTDWKSYRSAAVDSQVSYYPAHSPAPCLAQLGLFGVSAAEVPEPSMVAQNDVYQAFGIGGTFAPANDGSSLGGPVVAAHYSAMIASLRPKEAIEMWDWLIANGLFSPLNNVESLMFLTNADCDATTVVWNHLKGSWNLALQALGWGRYLAERDQQVPILWQAAKTNSLLRKGYLLLESSGTISTAASAPGAWLYGRECEYPDEETVGQMLERSNASGLKVHGQFGTIPAWPAKSGYVQFNSIKIPQADSWYLTLRYSKYSSSSVPILVYLDDESTPRATFIPIDQGDWNSFTWTEPILLGSMGSGLHSIKFFTDGQEFGVADLDRFVLANGPYSLPTP